MRKSTYIPDHGTYQYDQDIFDKQMKRTVDSLRAEVKERTEGMEITGIWKLRKMELAAMVAEWETAARENEQYLQQMEQEKAAKAIQPYRRQGPASDRVVARPATGPTITVVVQVGRKLVLGEVIGTVTRPMASHNRHLVTVRHLTDAGHPRVTLHAANEVAA